MASLSTGCRTALLAAAIGLALGTVGAKTLTARDRFAIEAAFARADADNDGRLTRQEAAALPEVAAKFEALDRNRDGLLSLEEFAASVTA